MSFIRFGLMIVSSTVVMFILMYLNTYAWEHVFYSETRTYMAILMGDLRRRGRCLRPVDVADPQPGHRFGAELHAGDDSHHSIAIMITERAQLRDPRVQKLAHEIVEA